MGKGRKAAGGGAADGQAGSLRTCACSSWEQSSGGNDREGAQGAGSGGEALPPAALCAGARASGWVSSGSGQGRCRARVIECCQGLMTAAKASGKAPADGSVYGGVVQQAHLGQLLLDHRLLA